MGLLSFVVLINNQQCISKKEFFDFLKTFGIIGLAIAFVIGQAASKAC
jgi:hypothetical protein